MHFAFGGRGGRGGVLHARACVRGRPRGAAGTDWIRRHALAPWALRAVGGCGSQLTMPSVVEIVMALFWVGSATADTPVHCLLEQMYGECESLPLICWETIMYTRRPSLLLLSVSVHAIRNGRKSLEKHD